MARLCEDGGGLLDLHTGGKIFTWLAMVLAAMMSKTELVFWGVQAHIHDRS